MAEARPLYILAISGSLRNSSCNTGLLRACAKRLPANVTMDVIVPDLPLYNQDLETGPIPPAVLELREKAHKADAFLFGCSEYNFSVSGALKNAIDWASRGDKYGNCFNDKPAALVGAAGGMGSLRSQSHLRDIAVFLNLHILNSPTLMINIYDPVTKPFDMATGELTDEKLNARAGEVMEALAKWTYRLTAK